MTQTIEAPPHVWGDVPLPPTDLPYDDGEPMECPGTPAAGC